MIILQIIGVVLSTIILGILINGCEEYTKNKSSNKNLVFKLEPSDSFGIPIISVKQKSKTFYFIVDTGANLSSINAQSLSEFKHTLLNGSGKVYGMEGNVVQVSYVKASFYIKKIKFEEEFQVFDLSKCFDTSKNEHGVNIIGILGNNFLKKTGLIVDVYNNVLFTN